MLRWCFCYRVSLGTSPFFLIGFFSFSHSQAHFNGHQPHTSHTDVVRLRPGTPTQTGSYFRFLQTLTAHQRSGSKDSLLNLAASPSGKDQRTLVSVTAISAMGGNTPKYLVETGISYYSYVDASIGLCPEMAGAMTEASCVIVYTLTDQ